MRAQMRVPAFAFAFAATAAVRAAVVDGSSLEGYVGEWCARQFPAQLRRADGAAAAPRERSVPLEPFCGRWCLEQYPAELAALRDDPEVLDRLYANHEKVAHGLAGSIAEWGEDAGGTARLPVEEYFGRWCAVQWPELFDAGFDPSVNVNAKEVPIEGPLGDFCFESFPDALASLGQEAEVAALYESHVRVEEELLMWYRDNQSMEMGSRR